MLRSTHCGILTSNVEVIPPRCLAVKPRNLTSLEVVFKKIKGAFKNVNYLGNSWYIASFVRIRILFVETALDRVK